VKRRWFNSHPSVSFNLRSYRCPGDLRQTVGDISSLLSPRAGVADGYLQPPATGEVEALSEKQLVNSITGAAVAALLHEGKPLTHLGVSGSGKCFDASMILPASDGVFEPARACAVAPRGAGENLNFGFRRASCLSRRTFAGC
jgi:hypothetical protein